MKTKPPIPSRARLGDVWLLGRHRLACGDAGEASVLAAALGGQQAAMLVTSPPYPLRTETISISGESPAPTEKNFGAPRQTGPSRPGHRRSPAPPRAPGVTTSIGKLHMQTEFVYWEGRPAVLTPSGGAFAILRPGAGWERVASAEVVESGRLISEAELRAWVPATRWPPPGYTEPT